MNIKCFIDNVKRLIIWYKFFFQSDLYFEMDGESISFNMAKEFIYKALHSLNAHNGTSQ
jgi:hypothetical protein